MSRHWAGAALAAACLLAGTIHAGADVPPAPEKPRAGCTHRIPDDEGDAVPDYGAGTTTKPAIGSKDGLDVTGVNFRLTADQLQVFLAIKQIPDAAGMGKYEASYRYTMTFKYSGKTFSYGIEQKNTTLPSNAQPLDGGTLPYGNMGGGANDALPGSTERIYPDAAPKPSYVIFTSQRSEIEKGLGDTPIKDGDKFTDITVLTQVWTSQEKAKGDSLNVAATAAVWTAGDDYCFGPPPTTLTGLTTPSVQYGDKVDFSAKLLDEKGAVLAGKPVQFSLTGDTAAPLTETTGDDGVATVTYQATRPAATYTVTARFAGDAEQGKSTATGTVIVKPENTAFNALAVAKPSSTARVVTATLLDDDKSPAAGQKVDWWVNGKKVATVATDAAGKSVYRGAKPTQTVQAKLVAVPGKYNAATSKSVKV